MRALSESSELMMARSSLPVILFKKSSRSPFMRAVRSRAKPESPYPLRSAMSSAHSRWQEDSFEKDGLSFSRTRMMSLERA